MPDQGCSSQELHTLVTEISLKGRNGVEIDCAAAKITPNIGTAASAAFTYTPAGVMVLTGIASWLKQLNKLGRNPLFEYRTTWASQGPIEYNQPDIS